MKTYNFLIQKKSKICPRALAESLKKQWFLNIPVKVAFTGHFRAHVELTQQLPRACQRRHPCQIIQCGPHARAHAEIRPKPSVSQRTQHKSIERIVVNQNLKFAIARALEDS